MCVELGCYAHRVMKEDFIEKAASEHKSREEVESCSRYSISKYKGRQDCDWIVWKTIRRSACPNNSI